MLLTNVLIATGSISLLTCIVSLLWLHLLPTGYNVFRDPVSNYAVSKYGYLYSFQTIATGSTAITLLAILNHLQISLPKKGVVTLGIYALARLFIFLFPTDVKPPATIKGRIHAVLAAVTFTGIAMATSSVTPALSANDLWLNASSLLGIASKMTVFSAIAFLVTWISKPLRIVAGLVERLIYLGLLFWFSIVFFSLLVHFL